MKILFFINLDVFYINRDFISMHFIVNRTDFTLYLTKEQWKRSKGPLVNGDINDPIITTTTTTTTKTTTTTTTSGENSSFKMIKSSYYFIYLFYLIFIF